MAKFKIFLMSLRNNTELFPKYSLMPISEFNSKYYEYDATQKTPIQPSELELIENKEGYRNKRQYSSAVFEQNNTFGYTYDEKFQIHQNTQRTLTFSMDRNVIRTDRIETNPFINYLFIGAQLLLVDKYDNHHLMTISKISYDFKSLNTVFKYECQDSFNYQLSRQSTGYEIVNDIDSSEFIGAQSLDWWVLCKIHPECKISYQYLKLNESNVMTKKPTYDIGTYPEFYRTIPFSASGTANSVLIALGELYGLQLRVYEKFDFSTGCCVKYYWFEPMKSLRPTGLKYSPYLDLQSFSLEHNSASFSSILNIQSNSIGEDIITVLPAVPSFFRQWFETKEWDMSLYIPGLFSSVCQEKIDFLQYNNASITTSPSPDLVAAYKTKQPVYDSATGYVYIPISFDTLSNRYPLLKFTTNSGVVSIFNIDGITEKNEVISFGYNSKYKNWEVTYKFVGYQEDTIYASQSEIPAEFMNNTLSYCFLQVFFAKSCKSVVIDGKIYVSQYRIPSAEELEFAEIADQIPWLENKLINFNYFFEHSIINQKEYNQLIFLLQNNLRKANAKLLLYSQLYYQAIQNKTKVIANLSAKIDKIGATFQADLINPFMTDGRAKETTEFSLAMSDLFENTHEPVKLITYYETLTDYVNKYFSAEQTFLKNMYLFREYFEAKSNLESLYSYTFTLKHRDGYDRIITFSSPNQYSKLTDANKHNPIYTKQDDTYLPYDKSTILNELNYKTDGLYYLNPASSGKTLIKEENAQYYGYSDDMTYYELQWEVEIDKAKELKELFVDGAPVIQSIRDGNGDGTYECEKMGSVIRIRCKNHCLFNVKDAPYLLINSKSYKYDCKFIYIKVDYTALRANFFYQQLKQENKQKGSSKLNFLHRRNSDFIARLRTTSDWKNFSELGISGSLLRSLSENKNIDAEDLKKLRDNDSETADKIYKQCFPISSYYWYGKAIDENGVTASKAEYHEVPFVNIENASQFFRRVSVSLESYKNWQTAAVITGGVATLGLFPFVPLGTLGSALVAPAIWGICQSCWNNGEKPFDNTGWSFHDVFNCDIDAFQGWNPSDRLLYTRSAESYSKTTGKSIFPSNISGEKWTETNPTASSWGYHEATNLLLTYSSLLKRLKDPMKSQYKYETTYYRILNPTDYVNKKDKFFMLWFTDEIDVNSLKIITPQPPLKTATNVTKIIKRLDSIIYYPLKNHMTLVSGSDFTWPKNENLLKLEVLLSNNNMTHYDIENDYVFKDPSKNTKVIYLKEETWSYEDLTGITWNSEMYNAIYQYAASNLYDNTTFEMINLITKFPELPIGFYVNGYSQEDYSSTLDLESLDDNLQYFKKTNNSYEPRYTMNQLINKKNMYVKLSDTYNYQSFSDIEEIYIQYRIYEKNDDVFKLIDSPLGTLVKRDSKWWLLEENLECSVTKEIKELSNYSNGAFWYHFKNSDSFLLMEKAMLIETNLMEYWTNAYYASKNCKYFLPEYWQPVVNQQQNYFCNSILNQTTELKRSGNNVSIVGLHDVSLSYIYVPQVRKISKQWRYKFKHNAIADNIEVVNTSVYGLSINEHIGLNQLSDEVKSISDVMSYLDIDTAEWTALKLQDNFVVYEHTSGGTLWTEMLEKLSNGALVNKRFGGWYDMMIKVLKTCNYENYNPIQYQRAQEEHDVIWRQIYTKYPNLCYEQSYSNTDATSSKELLQMAQWAFKDYTDPESNYNITVIDPNTLKGYMGQELKIGDGIEVDADEIYDDPHSDIYKSLIQYLYITDISYDLRRDDNIQLTVNNIKYSDKVIGQLIKLIR